MYVWYKPGVREPIACSERPDEIKDLAETSREPKGTGMDQRERFTHQKDADCEAAKWPGVKHTFSA
jgi:hypothetical protein